MSFHKDRSRGDQISWGARASIAALPLLALLPLPAHATLITSGNVSPGNLATSPTTTSQIFAGFSGAGSIEVNASTSGNGVTAVTGNFAGSISAVIGYDAGGNGTLSVIGDGTAGSASFTASRSLQIGVSGGTGNLTVQSGGLVQSIGAGDGITFGNTGSSGSGTVTGAGSILSSGGRINVGGFDSSTGSLTIVGGGLVQNTGNGDFLGPPDMAIGSGEGSSGIVTVDGAGSKLVTYGLLVGHLVNSTASLTIQNGGFASAELTGAGQGNGLTIGNNNGTANVTVTGAGSTLQIEAIGSGFLAGKEALIGGFAEGSLLVEQGGTVDATGAGILVGGGLNNTQTATGTLTVRDGGSVTADTVRVQKGGVLNGAGGTINGNVVLAGGTLAPGNSPGTMVVDGDLELLDGILQIEIGALASDSFVVSGLVTFGADLIIELVFLDQPAPGVEVDIASFFTGNAVLDFDQFDLETQLAVTGLGKGETATVRLGEDIVMVGNPAGSEVPAPASLALLAGALAGFGLLRRRATAA